MKRMIGLAAAVGLLVGLLAVPALAQGPCGTGVLIDWDADCFAFETNYTPATFNSANGSQLTVIGIVNLFCAPFQDLNPNDPNKEYTFVFSPLVSAGTQVIPLGPTTFYETSYGSGTFAIYEGMPRNAPTAAGGMPAPAAALPLFQDGTAILSGTLSNFNTSISRTGTQQPNGSFRADYQFTGGTLFGRVAGTGTGLMQGNWCVMAGCTPTGYSAHPNGKFDNPPTSVTGSTWGAIKQLFR